MFGGSNIDTSDLPHDVNKGRHVIYAGGRYDSYLLIPVIPERK